MHRSKIYHPNSGRQALFGNLVEELTGFSDFPADILEKNLAILEHNKNEIGDIEQLLLEYQNISCVMIEQKHKKLQKLLLQHENFLPLMVQITLLFYLGAIRLDGRWKRCGLLQHKSALVWRVLNTHPPMTRGTSGFADWTRKPEDIELTGAG